MLTDADIDLMIEESQQTPEALAQGSREQLQDTIDLLGLAAKELRALRSAAITFTPDERMSLYDMQADIEDSWDGDDKRTERALALLDRLLGATTHSQEPRLAGEEET
jgi:hypothetical protein